MNRIQACILAGAIALICARSGQADDLVSFATGGYASGLRTTDMMHKIDANGDGVISRDEWISFQERVFEMLDRNNNGTVDKAEYLQGNKELVSFATGGYASGLLTTDMFDKIDADRDGTISRDEFVAYHLKIFDRMDTSSTHKGMVDAGQFFATGGKPAP